MHFIGQAQIVKILKLRNSRSVYTCPLVPHPSAIGFASGECRAGMAGGSVKICLPRSSGRWYWGILFNLVYAILGLHITYDIQGFLWDFTISLFMI